MNWKGYGRSVRGLIQYTIRHLYEGTEEVMKTLNRNNRSPGRILNPGPPEYEAVLH
jgi:hypothetical protein